MEFTPLTTGLVGVAAAFGGAVVYANLPTRLTIGAIAPTVAHFKTAKLLKVEDENNFNRDKFIQGSTLLTRPTMVMAVRRPGCILCRREAAHLSNIKPLLDQGGIQFVAVVHEWKGVNEFKPYFKGDVYFDTQRTFFGPNERWLPTWMGMLRLNTYLNIRRSKSEGFEGNTEGEGRLLGGVYLIDSDGYMVYSHLEKEWGDAADVEEVKMAVQTYLDGKKLK